MARCSALSKRSGVRCKKHALKGRTTCANHGGKSLRGVESPHFKTGRYSRCLPDRLVEKYHEALADEELTSLNDELALVDSLLLDRLERHQQNSEEPIASGQVVVIVEQRRKLVDTERKRLMDEDRAIPIEKLMILMAAVADVVRRHVACREARRAISDEIRNLIGNDTGSEGCYKSAPCCNDLAEVADLWLGSRRSGQVGSDA